MMLKALIVEQLDADGTLRTFEMQPSTRGKHIVVAFADEYEDDRSGPFHFLNEDDARRFEKGFAACRIRKVGKTHFSSFGQKYRFEEKWLGIPTERHWLSYYALSLPEFAVPVSLSINDPHRPGHEYKRAIRRDDTRHRYVIYLDCSSSYGRFDFVISCDFMIDDETFSVSEYADAKTQQYGPDGDDWRYCLDQREQKKVQHFFVEKIHMGDSYSAGQAGAMGPNSQAGNITFQQIWNQVQGSVDLPKLAMELEQLQIALRSQAKEPEHEIAIGAVAAAEAAARKGNGAKTLEYLKKAGGWAFDTATKIGTDIAVAALKSSMGMP
jgi:hypothetical protein